MRSVLDVPIPQRFIQICMMSDEAVNDADLAALRDFHNRYGKEELYAFAKKKKVLPYAAHRLMHAGCEIAFWTDIHNEYLVRNQKVVDLLERVFVAFAEAGINKVCVSENFATVLSSGACLGCFSSGDVDFYCDDVDVDALHAVMESMGFVWSDRHKRKKSFAREYVSKDAIGEEFWLNFQWKPMTRKKTHLYDQRYILKRYHTLFDFVECYPGTHIKYFSPEAALYLNCVHIASGHYYILAPGMRLYADVDRLVRQRKLDWNLVKTWVEKDWLGLRYDMVLRLCLAFLKSPLGEEIFTAEIKGKRFWKLYHFLIDSNTEDFRLPAKGIVPYLFFLTKVELMSDGTDVVRALLKRFWVLIADWN